MCKGKLASSNWRLKFGRRSSEQLGTTDPTGSYCAMPDDWIKKKLAEAAVRPSNDELFKSELDFVLSASSNEKCQNPLSYVYNQWNDLFSFCSNV